MICGFNKGTINRYALLTLVISYCYSVIWAGSALLIIALYMVVRHLYLHQIQRYLLAFIIFIGVTCIALFIYYYNPVGLTIRLKESLNSILSIYYDNNYYGLWEHPPTHGLLTTIIYQGGLIGIIWIGLVIMYFYSVIRDVGYFFLICSIIFSYFWVYRYVHVVILVVLHISLFMPSFNMHLLRFQQEKDATASTV